MRTALGALLLTIGLYATLGAAFMHVQWSNPELAAASGAVALVAFAASALLLWSGPSRRWLVVMPALGLGFAFLVLSVVTTKCGMTAKGQDGQGTPLQELYVLAFGRELHLEVGPEEPMLRKMLLWGLGLNGAFVAVGSGIGALAGAGFRRLTTTRTA